MTEQVALFGPAGPELQLVEDAIRKVVLQDPPEVGRPMADLLEAGGKRIRPALVVLSAMCGAYDRERAMPAAMAVEVTHAATLVHDDVIDRSSTRRGRPTVAAALGDEEITLTMTEFNLLAVLAANPERVLTRAQLRDKVWGYPHDLDDHSVDPHVQRLRRKLSDRPSTGVSLEAVPGLGYRLSVKGA